MDDLFGCIGHLIGVGLVLILHFAWIALTIVFAVWVLRALGVNI